jgi:hypothetical protein
MMKVELLMNKRQFEGQKANAAEEQKVIRQLKQVYNQAKKDCEAKIAELNSRMDMQNLQAIVYQKQYQEALKKQIEGILDTLQSNQFNTITEYLGTSYENGFLGALYDLHGQGIPLIIPIDQSQVVQALQTDSKISTNMYTRLGENVTYLKKSIKAELSRGAANGSSWLEIATKIATGMNSPFNKALNNSMRIARTEGHRIQQQSQWDALNKAKDKGADIVKQWDSTLDNRTRETHRLLDGQIRELDEQFEVNGHKAKFPGAFGIPEEDIHCRCCMLQRAKWALDEDELHTLEGRAAYFGLDKSGNFQEFKDKYLKLPEVANKKDLEKAVKLDLQFFAKDNKQSVLEKISNGTIDKEVFGKSYQYFKTCFDGGITTPIGKVYDTKDRFYHIVDRHEYMMSEDNIDRMVNSLTSPREIRMSKDKFGNKANCFIEDAEDNTLIVIERNGIITAYEPSKRYLDKVREGELLWKKN